MVIFRNTTNLNFIYYKAPVRYQNPKTGLFEPDTDGPTDPYCWWSDTNCLHPKIDIPADYYKCDQPDMWGLSYDDGPFNRYTGKYASLENPYAEPALYNFLAEHNNQKANLMVRWCHVEKRIMPNLSRFYSTLAPMSFPILLLQKEASMTAITCVSTLGPILP